jgi:hypothetical protein
MSLGDKDGALPGKQHGSWKLCWKEMTRHWVGRVCVPCLPADYMAGIINDYYIDQEPKSFFKHAVRSELTRRYYESPDAQIRAMNRRCFWGGTAGFRWHEAERTRHLNSPQFSEAYFRSRGRMVEQIYWLLDNFPCFKNLCEIGTGNGLLIEYLSGSLTQVERFQGMDLSAEQIARNRAIFADSKVEYLHIEASEYILRHCRPGTLFVACGTFECFTQAEIEGLFALTRRTVNPTAFAICDAVAVDFDASIELNSRPRGNLFYSHNYRHLLEKQGYSTCFDQLEFPKPIYNRASLLATSFPYTDVKSNTQTAH